MREQLAGFTKFLVLVLGVCMVIGLGQPARADLAAVGPIDPVTAFPIWLEDAGGLKLGLCDVAGDAEAPPCLPELVDPGQGFVQGNIGEALYYVAEASFDGPNGESFLAICVLEAAAEGGAGDELVANAALIRLRGLAAGDYQIITPCGVFNGTIVDPNDDDQIRDEIGFLGFPPDFNGLLPGPVQFFASNGTGGNVIAPGTFIGDGVTLAPLQGELRPGGGTIFRVIGPTFDVNTDQFIVAGKIADRFGATLDRATYARKPAGAGTVDVFASTTADPVSTLTANDVEMLNDGSGRYFARLPFAALPDPNELVLINTTDDPQTEYPAVVFVDEVNILLAQYLVTAADGSGLLSVRASSSDMADGTVLTAYYLDGTEIEVLTGGVLDSEALSGPPSMVEVRSNRGGSASILVDVIGPVVQGPVL